MSKTRHRENHPVPEPVRELGAVLREEQGHYARLLDLAQRQGERLAGGDLEGLDACSQELATGLRDAGGVRQRREQLAAALIAASGHDPGTGLSTWLGGQPQPVQAELAGVVRQVRRTAGELARANEHNRRLASFCLDLVEEEASLLRRSLLEDPAGRYDRGARPRTNTQGGVLQRQA
jgi:hypothetical protein